MELRVTPTVLLTLIETSDMNNIEIHQNGKTRPIIGFCVSDVEELHGKLKDERITVSEIVRYNWGSIFEFFDLDSNRIEVWSGYSDEWSES